LAKGTTTKSGNSRIRFIMLEADLSDGDLSQVTMAIQNALRPVQASTKIVQIPVGKVADDSSDPPQEEQFDGEIELAPAITAEPKRVRSGSTQRRSFPTPKVVPVDWNVTPSIEGFMKEHPPKTTSDKYLAVLGWFKEAADKEAITVDEVYTVFRKLSWPTNIKDFSQPLRDLKGQQVLTGGSKAGFTINHIGLDRVKKFAEA
jgi:hypothetical protein